jgi:hypothetical protein
VDGATAITSTSTSSTITTERISTIRRSGPLAEVTVGSTILSTVAALPTQTRPLRTNMAGLPGVIPWPRGRRTRDRTKGNSVAGNRLAQWIAAATAGNRQAQWIAAAAVGNRQAQWIAAAGARIESVIEAFPAAVPHAEAELSAAAPAATVEAAREPAVLGDPPAWVPEEEAAVVPGAADGGGKQSHD